MSLSRFISPTFANIEIASPKSKLALESDVRWTSAGKTSTVLAEEGGDVLLNAAKVILEATGDLQSVFLNFPQGDADSASLPAGAEVTIIPTVNVAVVQVREGTTVLPEGALTRLTQYDPLKFTLVYQKEPFRRIWILS